MQSHKERLSRRLQRLREHHQACARRFNEATVRKTHLEQENNLLLTQQIMERKRKQEKELDLDTSDESGCDDGSDYVPSPNSTDGEDCGPMQLHNDAEMQEQEELKGDTDNLEENKWNKKEMIPLTEDVIKLQKYLKSVEENARVKLEEVILIPKHTAC
ncbi:hypothetical protein GJAV_G00040400 [Gymnothorax javanicus]|nr:hypothetical protein GJAV_G00040400 [Gymnothorax javanicus]